MQALGQSQLALFIEDLFDLLVEDGAELLFGVVSRAYERTGLIVTTNLPFELWTQVMGSQRLTDALLDRLTHRVHILEANGENFRLQDSLRRRKQRQPKKIS